MTEERFLTIKSQIRQLMEQDGFFEAANAARTTSETMKLLADNGIEMTAEEIEGFAKLGGELAQQIREADELSEEMLDAVAGGFKWGKFLMGCASVAGGLALMTIGGLVCAVPGGQVPGAVGLCVGGMYFAVGLATISYSF